MENNKNKKQKITTLPFIKTSDEDTMNLLKEEGFDLIDYNSGIWTFVNCQKNKLDFESNKKITYSNKRCI